MRAKDRIVFPGRVVIFIPVIGKENNNSEVSFSFPLGQLPDLAEVEEVIAETNIRLKEQNFDGVVGDPDYSTLFRTFTVEEFIKAIELQERLNDGASHINLDLLKGGVQ